MFIPVFILILLCILVLAQAGANVNTVTEGGQTALMVGAQLGELSLVSSLLVGGAEV